MSLGKFRFFLYLPLSIALFLGLERLCHKATDGFAVTRVLYPLKPSPISLNFSSTELSEVLAEPFTYLASGAQSYVFESQDHRYVIKLFKFHHLRIPEWISALPLPPSLKGYRDQKIQKKERLLEKTLESYTIAQSLLREETGLVYLHVDQTTHLNQKIHLIDKIGIHYLLDANSLPFVIQKKATPFYEQLLEDINHGDWTHAQQSITDFLQFSLKRCTKGIGDLDPDFHTNFGYIDGHIVQLDIGRFYLEDKEKDPEVYRREIYRITRSLHELLQKRSPLLCSHLDKEVTRIKGESLF